MKRTSVRTEQPINLGECGAEGFIPDPSQFQGETPYVSKRLRLVGEETVWETVPNFHYPTPMLDMMKGLVGGILKPLPWAIKQGKRIFTQQERRDFGYLVGNWRVRLNALNAPSNEEFGEMLQEHLRKRTCPSNVT